jgi:hypothetical protein
MKEFLRAYLMGLTYLDAWQREEIIETIEKMYQLKRKMIIVGTLTVIAIILSLFCIVVNVLIKSGWIS